MPADFTLLTTRAECDAATAEAEFELKTFSTRDANIGLADERADRTQTSTASQLAQVDAKIASNTALLAVAALDADTRETATDELAALHVRRTGLAKRNRLATGVTRFLATVDAAQIAAQVATLTSVKAGIATRRATLPA